MKTMEEEEEEEDGNEMEWMGRESLRKRDVREMRVERES